MGPFKRFNGLWGHLLEIRKTAPRICQSRSCQSGGARPQNKGRDRADETRERRTAGRAQRQRGALPALPRLRFVLRRVAEAQCHSHTNAACKELNRSNWKEQTALSCWLGLMLKLKHEVNIKLKSSFPFE